MKFLSMKRGDLCKQYIKPLRCSARMHIPQGWRVGKRKKFRENGEKMPKYGGVKTMLLFSNSNGAMRNEHIYCLILLQLCLAPSSSSILLVFKCYLNVLFCITRRNPIHDIVLLHIGGIQISLIGAPFFTGGKGGVLCCTSHKLATHSENTVLCSSQGWPPSACKNQRCPQCAFGPSWLWLSIS